MPRITRAYFLPLATLTIFTSLAANRAHAVPFTNLVVFGDSLSDIGNVDSSPFVDIPGPYYWNGRFSNGPIYAEALTTGLGLPVLKRSTATGGTDYAYGGAKTTGTGFPDSLVVKDIDDQVSSYVSSQNGNANTLYVVFAGANDLIGGQTNMSVPVGSLQSSMTQLYNDGARQFLVINLPPLGYTLRYNGSPSTITTYNTRSQQFNASLATMLSTFKTAHPTIALDQLDVYSLVNDARSNPQFYGLTNVTASAAPGLSPGASSYDTTQLAPNPSEYLFWDDLHPTTAVHQVLARRALDLFFPPGDYNRNVASDAGDYIAYRKGQSTGYVPIDYDIWRTHFGQTTPGGSGAGAFASAVPEPWGVAIAALLFSSLLASRRRRSE